MSEHEIVTEIDEIERRLDDLEEDITSTEILKADENAATRYAASVVSFPATRAAYTFGSIGHTAAAQVRDNSGNDNDLTNNNVVTFPHDLIMPYGHFVRGSNQYLSLADGGVGSAMDITGGEAIMPGAQQGMTICGWARFDTLAAATQYSVAAKWGLVAGQYGWLLDYFNFARFSIFTALGATITATSTVALSTGVWYKLTGQFNRPGNQISITVNDNSANVAAVAAGTTINDSTAAFMLGSKDGAAGNSLAGDLSGWSYAATRAENNALIRYQNERAGWGV